MSYGASIVWNSGTINLNNGTTYTLVSFTPRCNPISEESVVDTMRVKVSGTSFAQAEASLQAINKAFIYAGEHQRRLSGDRYHLYYAPDGIEGYRSEIIGFGDGLSRVEMEADYQSNWTNSKAIFADLYINRRNFWEQWAGEGLPMTNQNGAATTTLFVYNCNDGLGEPPNQHNNFMTIAGTAIDGDLPTPLELAFYIGATVTQAPAKIYMRQDLSPYVSGTSLGARYEAESNAAFGTLVAGTADSGTAHQRFGWSGTSEYTLMNMSFGGSAGWQLKNKPYALVGRLTGTLAYTDLYSRIQVLDGTSIFYSGPLVKVPAGDELVDFGFFTPRSSRYDILEPGTIRLNMVRNSSGSTQVNLDWVQVCGGDGAHNLIPIYGNAGDRILDDPDYGMAISRGTSQEYRDNYIAIGDYLMGQPGIDQRISLFWNNTSGSCIFNYGTVNITCRPRRLLI